MGVFACGWLGLVFAFGLCSCGCLRFLGVGALAWGGGTVWLRPPLSRLACLLACSRSGVGVVGVCDAPLGAG